MKEQERTYDLIIIGGGPAGLTAGIHTSKLGLKTAVFEACMDRVAMDAVGVAILRLFGTTPEVSEGRIFKQEQIARAVELGIGAQSARDIQLIPLDAESEKLTRKIERSFEVE